MEYNIDFKKLDNIWKESMDWTFRFIDTLQHATNNRRKVINLEQSLNILLQAENELIEKQNLIISSLEAILIKNHALKKFREAIYRLLNSTEILYPRKMAKVRPFQLFDYLKEGSVNEMMLGVYLEVVINNLIESWVAFNQSYGRLIISLKMNGVKFDNL